MSLSAALIAKLNSMCGVAEDSAIGTLLAGLIASQASLTIVGVDGTDGTATFTVQAVDSDGVSLANVYSIDFSMADTELAVPAAQTELTATTGTLMIETVANAAQTVLTDATGKAVFAVNAGGADASIFARASVGGVLTTLEQVITSV